MHAVSTNQIADILHFNNNKYYITLYYSKKSSKKALDKALKKAQVFNNKIIIVRCLV